MPTFVDRQICKINQRQCLNGTSGVDVPNLKHCKMDEVAREYIGTVRHTKYGFRCQNWSFDTPQSRSKEATVDSNFPDGSVALAGNWCRNPTNASVGPWCYVVPDRYTTGNGTSATWDNCDILLCSQLAGAESERKTNFGKICCFAFQIELTLTTSGGDNSWSKRQSLGNHC